MRVSIITVTYNNEKTINDYLDSILTNTPQTCELMIIDNKSSDKTCEKVRDFKVKKGIKRVKLIESAENSGFSKANNLGAKLSSNDILVFLNPDTKVFKDSLEILYKFIKSHTDAGIVAPAILRTNGNLQPSVRNLPTLAGVINEYIFGKKNAYSEFVPETKDDIAVESVYGTCMMIKKSIFEKVGGFNEKYFLYYEDLDLCRKINNLGLKVYYCPTAKISHVLGGSEDGINIGNSNRFLSELIPIKGTGRKYYQIKSADIYHGFLVGFLIRLIILISQKLGKNSK